MNSITLLLLSVLNVLISNVTFFSKVGDNIQFFCIDESPFFLLPKTKKESVDAFLC